jgi:NADP-dependent 3-hydroxy acid dehydrogenase YdfG
MTITMVTGATGGIGTAVVKRLRRRGDRVLAVGRDPAKIAALDTIPIQVDLADPDAIAPAFEAVGLDRLDAVVHCAGVAQLGTVAETPARAWRDQVTVNLLAAAEVTRCTLPALRAAAGQVVFLNFFNGYRAKPGWSAYAASKFGLQALADALRDEEQRHGIGVTTIYPACVATEMQRGVREHNRMRYQPESYIQPETVAELVMTALGMPVDARLTELTLTMRPPAATPGVRPRGR